MIWVQLCSCCDCFKGFAGMAGRCMRSQLPMAAMLVRQRLLRCAVIQQLH
jgi:hypothetical protein